jgi:hypothetical protein
MKIGQFSVIPTSVRFDRKLSPLAILLWGEISASCNEYGLCEDNNSHFANLYNVDVRTIGRLMVQLVENGHIVRLTDNGKRKLQIILKAVQPPESDTLKVKEEITFADIQDFCNKIFSMWCARLGAKAERRLDFESTVKNALTFFTEEELLKIIESRIGYIRELMGTDLNATMPEWANFVDLQWFLQQDKRNLLKWLKVK